MKTIPVRFSAEVTGEMLVSDQDYEMLARHRWHMSAGYAQSHVDGKSVPAHRLIFGLVPGDGVVVDHMNHKTLDNRRENLRLGDYADNNLNLLDRSGKTVSVPDGVAHLRAQGRPVPTVQCAGCGAVLSSKRRKWCSDQCRYRTMSELLRYVRLGRAA
jgi:hypothetical protein